MSGHESGLPLSPQDGGGRYPGLRVMPLSRHWDNATIAVVASRLGTPPDLTFFTRDEVVTASALTDRLLAQDEDPRVPVVNMIDARLAANQTDGWHYEDMPTDTRAWQDSLAGLEADARERGACRFHELHREAQDELLHDIQRMGSAQWHGMPAGHVWNLWNRYVCSAFYSHPWAWEEIGFTGPAYPRGYKNIGIDAREPFEVADARPELDPTRMPSATDRDESAERQNR